MALECGIAEKRPGKLRIAEKRLGKTARRRTSFAAFRCRVRMSMLVPSVRMTCEAVGAIRGD